MNKLHKRWNLDTKSVSLPSLKLIKPLTFRAMEKFNYGENLRIIRQNKGISQDAMAHNLKISQKTYSRIESRATMRDNFQVSEIARVLGVEPFELLPPLMDMTDQEMRAVRGSGLAQKAKIMMKSPGGIIILLAASVFLVNVSYEAAQGFCDGLGTSYNTKVVVSWIVALGTIGFISYWLRKVKRLE